MTVNAVRRQDFAVGVSFFVFVSTAMIIFEMSKTESVSPRDSEGRFDILPSIGLTRRKVASFMEKRASRGRPAYTDGQALGCVKEDS